MPTAIDRDVTTSIVLMTTNRPGQIPSRNRSGRRAHSTRSGRIAIVGLFLALTGLATVQATAQFGKNKVQYRDFDWKFIQSANFDVYYYDESGLNLAMFTADVAENALSSIEKTVRFSITDRISIIVYASKNDFQQTNVVGAYMPEGVGGVTELFKNRIVVPFEGEWEKFRHVIHHELVHAVLNDKFYGGSVQNLIANNIQVDLPIWMNEGLAEFEAYDGLNLETDMFVRDAVVGTYFPRLSGLNGYFAYRGGQTFYAYVAETYGRQKIGELLDRLRVESIDDAFSGAFGLSLADFSDAFLYDLKKRYWPGIVERERPRDFSDRLTDHRLDDSFLNASPSISPDGSQVAFISDREGARSLYVLDVDNPSDVRKLVEGERNVEFEELHLLSPRISWSSDSRLLAMAVKSRGRDVVMIIDAESASRESISFDLDAIYSVAWAPDGDRLLFQGIDGDQSDIYLYEPASGRLDNLTADIYSDFDPVWTPDGRGVVFISDRRDNPVARDSGQRARIWEYDYSRFDLYRIDIDARSLFRLTLDDAREKSPSFTSDGSMLYVSNASGIDNIYVRTPDADDRPLTNAITAIDQLSITPDGSRMVFAAWDGTGYDLFLMRGPLERRSSFDTIPMTPLALEVFGPSDTLDSGPELEKSIDVVTDLSGYGPVVIDPEPTESVRPERDEGRSGPDDRVPDAALAHDGLFVPRDYRVRFSTDIIQANGAYSSFYGPQGVVQALFSDELGDHRILVATDLQLDLLNSDFYFFYDYLADRIDYRAGLYQQVVLFRVGQFGEITRFTERGGSLQGAYPIDRFRRVEASVALMNVTRDRLEQFGELDDQSKFLVTPGARLVFDNTESLIFSPVRGSRYYLDVKASPAIGTDGVGFLSATTDLRHYVPFDRFGLIGLALRGSGGASFGPDPQQFFVGGVDGFWINSDFATGGIPIENAEDYSLFAPAFPLRAYDWGEMLGSKYGLVNAEFRFPLLIGGSGGLIPSLLPFVTGVAFVDAAVAFDDDLNLTFTTPGGVETVDDLRIGAGIGLRSYFFGLPVRFDVAWPYDVSGWGNAGYFLSIGSDF